MDTATIDQLNQLNKAFYQQVSDTFDNSRQYFWDGWELLKPYLHEVLNTQPTTVVDLGCGNGRFAGFLDKSFRDADFNYLGLDNSVPLLKKAANQQPHHQFREFDLLSFLQNQIQFPVSTADVLVSFGVTHHIPSTQLRQQLISKLAEKLNNNGILILSFWQFMQEERYKKKTIDPTLAGFNPNQLETNDFILDWKRGKHAYRYCHYWDDTEIESAYRATSLQLISSFTADSKSGTANRYLILKK